MRSHHRSTLALMGQAASAGRESLPGICAKPPSRSAALPAAQNRQGARQAAAGQSCLHSVVTVTRLPRKGQCAALWEARRHTVVTAESAWRSALAVRAEGSRRSAASARRWTSTRATGNATDSSTHMRSLLDRNIHMRSILPVTASKATPSRTGALPASALTAAASSPVMVMQPVWLPGPDAGCPRAATRSPAP